MVEIGIFNEGGKIMKCETCKYYADGFCDYAELDDAEYPHHDRPGMGIRVYVHDDSGLIATLRVDPDFYCAKYVSEYIENF